MPPTTTFTTNAEELSIVFVIHHNPRQFGIAKYWFPVLVYFGRQSIPPARNSPPPFYYELGWREISGKRTVKEIEAGNSQ